MATSSINLRPEMARHLAQRVLAFSEGFRHNLALIGPPGSGKTFQVNQLLARLPPEILSISCPLYREACGAFLHRWLATVEQAASGLPSFSADREGIQGFLERRAYHEAFTRILDLIPRLLEQRQQPCVLVIDEFLLLEEMGLTHAFHELGKRVMTWPKTLFVLTSSNPSRARQILRERFQLLFGQFELLMLELLDQPSVTTWLERELQDVSEDGGVNPFFIGWLGGSPWYLTVFIKRLRELALLTHTHRLTDPLFVEAAWDLLGSAEGVLYQWCRARVEPLAHIHYGRKALEALVAIAEGARTTTAVGQGIGRSRLSEALQVLVEHDLVERRGTCWLIPDPILRCWLTVTPAVDRQGVGMSHPTLRERFDRYLMSLWQQWLQASQRSFSERMAEVFTRFHDEMIVLDSKTGRLPQFQTVDACHPPDQMDTYLVAQGQGSRWCAAVHETAVSEQGVAAFETFCRRQLPRPSRKIVVAAAGIDENAKLLAKAINMWVWERSELNVLLELYERR